MLAEAGGTENSWPALGSIAYQAAFAMITTSIITGSVAGRMRFGAVVLFVVIWVLVVYAPLAHMVWGGVGSFIGDKIGALDFAGGDVVHISSGVSGLVLCLILGRRKGYGLMNYRPHNVPFVVLGATMLWFGWFGFNGGSAFAADGIAALAILNTLTASAAGLLSWTVVERIKVGKPTLVGAATGLVAGLVVITPAAGFVEPWAAVVMGVIVSPVCYFAISFLKHRIGYDDALDAFGCHAIGGMTGGVLTGLFCVPELQWASAALPEPTGGLLYSGGDPSLLIAQILGILVTLVFVSVAVLIIGLVVKLIFRGSLRVDTAEENEGLDTVEHGESAYPAFNGLD
jgi:Amt family ammonium transporter